MIITRWCFYSICCSSLSDKRRLGNSAVIRRDKWWNTRPTPPHAACPHLHRRRRSDDIPARRAPGTAPGQARQHGRKPSTRLAARGRQAPSGLTACLSSVHPASCGQKETPFVDISLFRTLVLFSSFRHSSPQVTLSSLPSSTDTQDEVLPRSSRPRRPRRCCPRSGASILLVSLWCHVHRKLSFFFCTCFVILLFCCSSSHVCCWR